MRELSLHVLDVVENSVSAGARHVIIEIHENQQADLLTIEIRDDGRGMDQETLSRLFDPFFTTRKERKVGLGLSLFREAARMCDGDVVVRSAPGEGTTVTATFRLSHIDRAPIGDMGQTLVTLIVMYPEIEFCYDHARDHDEFVFCTQELRKSLEVSLTHPMVLDYVWQSIHSWLEAPKDTNVTP